MAASPREWAEWEQSGVKSTGGRKFRPRSSNLLSPPPRSYPPPLFPLVRQSRKKRLNTSLSLMLSIVNARDFALDYFAGWFGEVTGHYRNLFFLAVVPTITGAFIFSLIHCVKDPLIESQQKRALVIPDQEKEIIFVYDRLTVV